MLLRLVLLAAGGKDNGELILRKGNVHRKNSVPGTATALEILLLKVLWQRQAQPKRRLKAAQPRPTTLGTAGKGRPLASSIEAELLHLHPSSREDIRAFDRWERRVEVWWMQIAAYMSRAEAAMMLFTSLKGKAEEELESYDLNKINCAEGIENILSELRGALQTRAVYQKRKFLHEFEQIGRYGNEGVRSFCNRYAGVAVASSRH